MTPIQILPPYEEKQFDKPPRFSPSERKHFFSVPPQLKDKVSRTHHVINKIGLVVQYGYFIATGKFYEANQYRKYDIKHIAKMLDVVVPDQFSEIYASKTRYNHKYLILERLGYFPFSKHKTLFNEALDNLVEKQMHPRKIIFALIDLLRSKKIEVPNYTKFATPITHQLNKFERNLISRVKQKMTQNHIDAFDELIGTDGEYYQRPIITKLKHINQAIRPKDIKHSIQGFLIVKKLYN
jgi:hypothetical protein